MSIIPVLLLLFLSLHSCNARILLVARNDQDQESHSITSSKGKIDERENGGGGEVERETANYKRKWKVVSEEAEAEAGFNQLDYLPPRTHPPVHN